MMKNLGFACGIVLLCACEGDVQEDTARTETPMEEIETKVASTRDGEIVYQQHCASCHATGVEGAPALDHAPSWASRSPEWSAVLKQHAIEGFVTMPAKGGNPELSESEVVAAVDYMVSRIMPPSILGEGKDHGRLVYQAACSQCHDTGVDGAPVIGDTAAWAARSLNWHTVLEQHASHGFLRMPPKGDQLQLFHEDVAAAVAFMVGWAKRN